MEKSEPSLTREPTRWRELERQLNGIRIALYFVIGSLWALNITLTLK